MMAELLIWKETGRNNSVGNIVLKVPVIRTVIESSGWRLLIAEVELAADTPAAEGKIWTARSGNWLC
jgi:hypothetical protein